MANVQLVQIISLGDAATGTQTSTINEPTAAASGNNAYVTGNWFASRSTNGAAGWSLVNPFTTLPSAAGGSVVSRSSCTSGTGRRGSRIPGRLSADVVPCSPRPPIRHTPPDG